jgi:hypothetical protein
VDDAGASVGEHTGNAELELTEEWTDESLADEGGKPKEIRRAWSAAAAKLSHVFEWKGDSLLKGVEARLANTSRGTVVTALKGGPEKRTLEMLGGVPAEAAAALLPSKAANAGDTWDVPQPKVVAFVDALIAGVPSVKAEGDLQNSTAMILMRAQAGKTTVAQVPALKAKFASLADGKATVEAFGTQAIPGDAQKKGAGECKVTVTFVFDTGAGAPSSLDATIEQHTGPSSAWVRFGANGQKEEVGLKETWTISRKYEPAK